MHDATTNVPGRSIPFFWKKSSRRLGGMILDSYPFVPVVGRSRLSLRSSRTTAACYFGVTGDSDGAAYIVCAPRSGISARWSTLLALAVPPLRTAMRSKAMAKERRLSPAP